MIQRFNDARVLQIYISAARAWILAFRVAVSAAAGCLVAISRTVAGSILLLAGSLLCLLDVDRLGTLLLRLQCGTLYGTGCYLYKLYILEYRIQFRTRRILDVDTLDMSVALEFSGTVCTIADNRLLHTFAF